MIKGNGEELILSGESHIEAALRHLQAGNFEGAKRIAELQDEMQKRYEDIFSELQEGSKSKAREDINGIGLLTSHHIDILAAFYSAENVESLGGVFKSISFLQNMTQFGGAKTLYLKDPNIRNRIINSLCAKYPILSNHQEQLMKLIEGEYDIMSSFYPNPYLDNDSNTENGKLELMDFYENLLFQELKKFLFPELFQRDG